MYVCMYICMYVFRLRADASADAYLHFEHLCNEFIFYGFII